MMIHKAVINLNPAWMSVPSQRIPSRSLPRRAVAPAGGKWRGYSQKRRGHAMVGRRAGAGATALGPIAAHSLAPSRMCEPAGQNLFADRRRSDARALSAAAGQKFFHL